jgi:hypothetical protein
MTSRRRPRSPDRLCTVTEPISVPVRAKERAAHSGNTERRHIKRVLRTAKKKAREIDEVSREPAQHQRVILQNEPDEPDKARKPWSQVIRACCSPTGRETVHAFKTGCICAWL